MLDTQRGLLAVPGIVAARVKERPLYAIVLVLGLVAVFVVRHWLARCIEFEGATESKTAWSTVMQLTGPVVLALPGPIALWVVASWLRGEVGQGGSQVLAQALQVTAVAWFVAAALSGGFRRHGIAEGLLGFGEASTKVVRRQLSVFQSLIVPLVFPLAWLAATRDPRSGAVMERVLFITIQLMLAYLLHRLLRPSSGVLANVLVRLPTSWPSRLRPVWYLLGIGFPITLAVLTCLGYYYTAWQLLQRALFSVAMVAIACTLYVVGTRRRPARPGVVRRRTESTVSAAGRFEASWHSLLGGVLSLAVLGAMWFTWSDTFSALQILDRVELWTTTASVTHTATNNDGEMVQQSVPETVPITLADLGVCVILFVVAFFAGRTLPALLDVAVISRLPFDHGARHAVLIICRYLVVLFGGVVALRSIGVSWSSVQWLAAAMTVGLGFGLQEIFANLVSGLIILFERPIRIGDLVTVGGTTGKVTKMQIRATTITDFDRRELVVPNKKFITEDVVNWTLSDPITRFVIPVGISYSSNPTEAQQILLRLAKQHPNVMDEPAASAVFTSFGASTLDMELRAFLPTRDNYPTVVHELNVAIEREFREAGLEIAFPQQDLHIRSLPANVSISARPAVSETRRAA